MSRFWIIFLSRNKEFYRDRSAFGWALLFPVFILVGFSLIFDRGGTMEYKVGVVAAAESQAEEQFPAVQYIDFIPFATLPEALDRLEHHSIDVVIDYGQAPARYYVSETSPKGYLVESVLSSGGAKSIAGLDRHTVTGSEVPYLDWLFPGILGMNIMFGALFGVGYVIVRYRKNGALKRLSVTPLTAFEFMGAHLASRLMIMLTTTAILYIGCAILFDFRCAGSYATLALVFALGSASMVAFGLLVAARTASEELAGGLLNFASWPMMFLSEVWFSMEGAHPAIQHVANLLPLTHMIRAAREIMNDGATIIDVGDHVIVLTVMMFVFLGVGAMFFRWEKR